MLLSAVLVVSVVGPAAASDADGGDGGDDDDASGTFDDGREQWPLHVFTNADTPDALVANTRSSLGTEQIDATMAGRCCYF